MGAEAISRRKFVKDLGNLVFSLSLPLSLTRCNGSQEKNQVPKFCTELWRGKTRLIVKNKNRVEVIDLIDDIGGFEKLEEDDKLTYNKPWHKVYETEDDTYLIQSGANTFLVSKKGKLLTQGSFGIIKYQDNMFLYNGGSKLEKAKTPKTYDDLKGTLAHVANHYFEERDDGIYLKKHLWNLEKK